MNPQLTQAESEALSPETDPFRELHLLRTAPQELVVEVYWHIVQQLQKGSVDDPDLRTRLDKLNEAYSRILGPETSPILDGRDELGNEGGPGKKSWLPFRGAKQQSRQQSPWGLLHLDPGAPPDVVDLAYLFWRMRLRSQWRESAGANLDELQGAYEALRQDSSAAEAVEGDAVPALEKTVLEPSGGAEDEADDEVTGQQDTDPLREIEAVSAQGRGLPVVGALGRWAKRAFGAKRRPEAVSGAQDGFVDQPPLPDVAAQSTGWPQDVADQDEARPQDAADEDEARPQDAAAQDEAWPQDVADQDEAWPSAWAVEGDDEPLGVLEDVVAAPVEAVRLEEVIPAEYRIDGPGDGGAARAQLVAQPSEALAYLVADSGSVRDVRAVIGSQPLAIGSGSNCGLMVGGPSANGGAIAARIWAHDGRFMLHVLAKEPAVLVNGQAMVWAVLEDGDRLQFGDGAFRFERAGAPGNG